jgi:hypothetical protein
MSLGTILLIILVIVLLGGFSRCGYAFRQMQSVEVTS